MENQELATQQNAGMINLPGMSIPFEDLPIPSIRLVHPTSNNIMLSTGENAQPGTFYNNSRKEATKDIKFRVVKVVKTHVLDKSDKAEEGSVIPAYNVLAWDIENSELFVMMITKSSYWNFRNNILGLIHTAIKEQGGSYIPVVTGDAVKLISKDNRPYLAISFTADKTKAPDEGELETLKNLQEKYSEFGEKRVPEVTEGIVELHEAEEPPF